MAILTAFYDFAVAPASYDFVKFLAGTASMAKALGHGVHVIFVPADTPTGFRIDHKPTTADNKAWRRDNLCVPACRLIDATYTVLPHRDPRLKADIQHPKDWTAEKPTAEYWFAKVRDIIAVYGFAPFKVDPQAKAWVEKETAWLGHYVTVTMRQTYYPACDSDLSAWGQLNYWLGVRGERVVVVPDTDHAFEASPLGTAAALNPLIRHALYAGAKMNLGVGAGTQSLCWFGDLPFISFKMLKDNFNGTPDWYQRWGLPVGSQLPWGTDRQRIVWDGSDTFENMKRHYLEMMGEDEGAKAA